MNDIYRKMNSINEKNETPPTLSSSYEKPCRTCMDFRTWMKMNRNKAKSEGDKNKMNDSSNSVSSIPTQEKYEERSQKKESQATTVTEPLPSVKEEDPPKTGMAAKYGCPADIFSLGRGSWRLLHTMAAYYPETPSEDEKDDMNKFITLFSKLYPCPPCAGEFRQWLKENPPDVSSKNTLSNWFCSAHNEVNRKLDKPEFDCTLYDQMWRDGWKDGSCD